MAGTEAGTPAPGNGPTGRRPVLLAGGLLSAVGLMDIASAPAATTTDPYVVGDGNLHHLDLTGWAWLDLVVGVATAITGLVLIADRRWTALLGIGCAGVSMAVDVLLLPYAPPRVVLALALSVAAVRLLVRHRLRRPSDGIGRLNQAGRSAP